MVLVQAAVPMVAVQAGGRISAAVQLISAVQLTSAGLTSRDRILHRTSVARLISRRTRISRLIPASRLITSSETISLGTIRISRADLNLGTLPSVISATSGSGTEDTVITMADGGTRRRGGLGRTATTIIGLTCALRGGGMAPAGTIAAWPITASIEGGRRFRQPCAELRTLSRRRLGWALQEAVGPENASLPLAGLQEIYCAFATAGIPHESAVEALEHAAHAPMLRQLGGCRHRQGERDGWHDEMYEDETFEVALADESDWR